MQVVFAYRAQHRYFVEINSVIALAVWPPRDMGSACLSAVGNQAFGVKLAMEQVFLVGSRQADIATVTLAPREEFGVAEE
jgi:hypothetical protein